MEMNGQLHAPAALRPVKEPWYPLDRNMGGPQGHSGRDGEENNSQPLPGIEPPIIQAVAQRYTTELPCRIEFCSGTDVHPVFMFSCVSCGTEVFAVCS
jgi:hypothetical protein